MSDLDDFLAAALRWRLARNPADLRDAVERETALLAGDRVALRRAIEARLAAPRPAEWHLAKKADLEAEVAAALGTRVGASVPRDLGLRARFEIEADPAIAATAPAELDRIEAVVRDGWRAIEEGPHHAHDDSVGREEREQAVDALVATLAALPAALVMEVLDRRVGAASPPLDDVRARVYARFNS